MLIDRSFQIRAVSGVAASNRGPDRRPMIDARPTPSPRPQFSETVTLELRLVFGHDNKRRIVVPVLTQAGHWCFANSGVGPSFGAHSAVPEHYEEVLRAKFNLATTQLVDEELNPVGCGEPPFSAPQCSTPPAGSIEAW